jgi:hypothetical protein
MATVRSRGAGGGRREAPISAPPSLSKVADPSRARTSTARRARAQPGVAERSVATLPAPPRFGNQARPLSGPGSSSESGPLAARGPGFGLGGAACSKEETPSSEPCRSMAPLAARWPAWLTRSAGTARGRHRYPDGDARRAAAPRCCGMHPPHSGSHPTKRRSPSQPGSYPPRRA